jgi:hypothetical protein
MISDEKSILFQKDQKKVNLAKISYKISVKDNIRIGVVTINGDWETDRYLSYRLMKRFVYDMSRRSNVEKDRISVKLYSSDENFEHKLSLFQELEFIIKTEQEDNDQSIYHLIHRRKKWSFRPGVNT